ncbi:MAG: ABC transporter ATP-binding protein [Terriglobia bacterium]
MEAVLVEKVTKRYGQVTAVRGLDLCVRKGALFGLLGPNGAGKTTTLRMLLRMLVPDEGEIRLFGAPLTDDSQNQVGYLPEERGLYPRLKVRDNLVFFASIKGVPESEARRRAASWLARLELGKWADRKVIDLSKGMQQKVQFIAAIIHKPPLLILDEPFAGLDPVNATLVKDLMLELKNQGATVILSTHRMEQVEMMCESICLIHAGRKVLDGELKAIKKSYGKNTLRMEFEGDGDFLNFPELIEKVNHYGEVVEAKLRPGADPQEILKRAVESGVRINRFELAEPPLNDIFIDLVSKTDA